VGNNRWLAAAAGAVAVVWLAWGAGSAGAMDFTVTTTMDGADGNCTPSLCTLRGALTAAHSHPPPETNTITLPAGTYVLSANLPTIDANTTINGAGAFSTSIDGGSGAGVMHALQVADGAGPVTVTISGVALQRVTHASGGTLSVNFSQHDSALNVTGSIVRQNSADSGSAGIEATGAGTVNISDTTVAGNHDATLGAVAMLGGANVTMARSTIAGNSGGDGAAVCLECDPSTGMTKADFVNVTISGVSSDQGAIVDDRSSAGVATFSYDTISANTPAPASAVIVRSASSGEQFKGNIISGNTGTNCSFPGAAPMSGGFNFDDGLSCRLMGTGDQPNTPVALGTRGRNGGPTATQPLLGPVGVDAGGPPGGCTDVFGNPVLTDERGLARPQGTACDPGAVEKWAGTATTTSATLVTSDGATLQGIVDPNGVGATYQFDYGTTTIYGSSTSRVIAGSGTSDVGVSAPIAGLTGSTVYHYRVVANSDFGTVLGGDRTFTTAASPTPPAMTPPVSPVGAPRCSLSAVSSRVVVSGRRSGKRRISTGTLSVKVSCDQAVTGTVTGTVLERIPSRRRHGRPSGRTFKLGPATVSLNGRSASVVALKVPADALAGLRMGRRESASLALVGRNANGRAAAGARIRSLRL
jgi:CSLREA domain-containing protein